MMNPRAQAKTQMRAEAPTKINSRESPRPDLRASVNISMKMAYARIAENEERAKGCLLKKQTAAIS